MMSLPASRDRLALLQCAFGAGIRHFDTAPYYGHGEAERVVGRFLRGRRDEITIATKYGIQSASLLRNRWLNLFARQTVRMVPSLRKTFADQSRAFVRKSEFRSEDARKSLDRSLSSLKTDYVDLFLLHEPTYEDAASDEMVEFLQNEVARGRVRTFGCGGSYDTIERIARDQRYESAWMQFEDNALTRRMEGVPSNRVNCITFGAFKALPFLNRWLDSDTERRPRWSRELDYECLSTDVLAAFLQASSHARNPNGVVLFSTRRADHIAQAVDVASGSWLSRAQVAKFLELTSEIDLHA